MKRIKGITLLLLAFMLCTTACGGDGAADTDAAGQTEQSTDTEETVDEETLDLPDSLKDKYAGEAVTIVSYADDIVGPGTLVDENGNALDVFGEAMYQRRMAVEEKLGIEFDSIIIPEWQSIANIARQSINAGSDDYDIIFTPQVHQMLLINEGLYMPLEDLPYIDIDKPWWDKEYINSTSVKEGETYLLFGDITYRCIERTVCVFFNIDLLESRLGMNSQDLYDLVYDGKWTLDKFTELVSQVYADDNGNTVNDIDDIHGLTYSFVQPFEWMAFSCGFDYTAYDGEGYPQFNVNSEKTVDMLDKLCTLFFNNDAVFRAPDNNSYADAFSAGKSLFCINRFFLTSWDQFRTMSDGYGILPLPKYDESIDGYHSMVGEYVPWGAVPVTVENPELVSAVAEALAFYGRKYITPAYYDVSLKLKQTRDDESMEMIDIIMEGRNTDFLFVNDLGGMDDIFKKVWTSGQNNFSSLYASLEQAAQLKLQELIDSAD